MISGAASVEEIIELLRGSWGYVLGRSSLRDFISYVLGACDAKGLNRNDAWGGLPSAADSYLEGLGLSTKSDWIESIEGLAQATICEIPIFYAVWDYMRGRTGTFAYEWNSAQEWRNEFGLKQSLITGASPDGVIPAPHIVRLECISDKWMLHYFDERGLRYYEVILKRGKVALIEWAEEFLGIKPDSWKESG